MSTENVVVDTKSAFEQLTKTINEFGRVKQSPLLFLDDYVREEIAKIDVVRETKIDLLDKYYGRMIQRLHDFKQRCADSISNAGSFEFSLFDSMQAGMNKLAARL